MRRILSAFVLAFVMVAFVGCKKKAEPAGVAPTVSKSNVDAAKAAANDASAEAKKAAAEIPKKLPAN